MIKYLLDNFGITKFILIVVAMTSIISVLVFCIILNQVIESHDEEMTQIIASDVYDEINSELLKPVIVSQTMAKNIFLRQDLKFTEQPEIVNKYLLNLKESFDCTAAFLAVDRTKNYYTLNGLQKTLDWEKDPHDIWYKNFLDTNLDHELNVDTDEANNFALTIFVNTRMFGDNGETLGICGIGVGMEKIQKILQKNEDIHGIKINLVNKAGLVQVDSESDKVDILCVFIRGLQCADSRICCRSYVVTKYIPQFDWYLVIHRDTQSRQSAFSNLVLYLSVTWVILLALLLTFIQSSLNKGEKQIKDSATKLGIASHSGIYVSMHLIDLQKNSIHELSSNAEVKIFQIQDGLHAKEKIISAVKKMTNKESLRVMLEFIRLSTLPARMTGKQAITQEFLSEDFGWCKAYFMLVDDNHDGTIKKSVFAIELIDEEKRREKHLKYLSETDLMTGLHNRGSGERIITELMAKNVEGMFCLLDADKFKSVNDNFGHEVGDKVIKAIANCLKNSFKNSDITLRLGGDEFAAYAIGATNEIQCKVIINRLFSMIDAIAIPELGDRKISISLGAAIFHSQSGETFTELYKRADSAAYTSKKTSGNCFTFAEENF